MLRHPFVAKRVRLYPNYVGQEFCLRFELYKKGKISLKAVVKSSTVHRGNLFAYRPSRNDGWGSGGLRGRDAYSLVILWLELEQIATESCSAPTY